MTPLVIDASVAVKLVVDEHSSDRAVAVRAKHELIAPGLLHAEVASALSRKVAFGILSPDEAAVRMTAIVHSGIRIVPDEYLAVSAVALSAELGHPVYDCFYLALAEAEGLRVVTADRALFDAATQGGHGDNVRWIEDV